MLTDSWPELTRPMYSSINLVAGTGIRVGLFTSSGILTPLFCLLPSGSCFLDFSVVPIRHQVGEGGQRSLVGRLRKLSHDRARLVGERLGTFPHAIEAAPPLDHVEDFGKRRLVVVGVAEDGTYQQALVL